MIFGLIVVIVIGILVANYFQGQKGEGVTTEKYCEEYSHYSISDVPARCYKYFTGGDPE